MKHLSLAILPISLFIVFLTETKVEAYLDPGSGSMLVQLLLGGVAGAAVIAKLSWQRLRGIFQRSTPEPLAAQGERPQASGEERTSRPRD
jgi:hypothetical protein